MEHVRDLARSAGGCRDPSSPSFGETRRTTIEFQGFPLFPFFFLEPTVPFPKKTAEIVSSFSAHAGRRGAREKTGPHVGLAGGVWSGSRVLVALRCKW